VNSKILSIFLLAAQVFLRTTNSGAEVTLWWPSCYPSMASKQVMRAALSHPNSVIVDVLLRNYESGCSYASGQLEEEQGATFTLHAIAPKQGTNFATLRAKSIKLLGLIISNKYQKLVGPTTCYLLIHLFIVICAPIPGKRNTRGLRLLQVSCQTSNAISVLSFAQAKGAPVQ
jgi:hypothetical protein